MASAGKLVRTRHAAALTVSLLLASAFLFTEALVPGEWHTATAATQTCKEKRRACEARCRGRYPNDWTQITSCYSRTCDKQYDNCKGAGSGTTGTRVDVDQPKGRPITPNVVFPGARPGGGILDAPQSRPPLHVPSGTGVLAPN